MIWTQEGEIFYREGKKYLEGCDVGISIGKELGYLEIFEKVLDFMKSIGISKEHLNDFMNSDLTPKTWRRSTSMLLTREEEAYCDGYAIGVAIKEAGEKKLGLLDTLKYVVEVMRSRGMEYWQMGDTISYILKS